MKHKNLYHFILFIFFQKSLYCSEQGNQYQMLTSFKLENEQASTKKPGDVSKSSEKLFRDDLNNIDDLNISAISKKIHDDSDDDDNPFYLKSINNKKLNSQEAQKIFNNFLVKIFTTFRDYCNEYSLINNDKYKKYEETQSIQLHLQEANSPDIRISDKSRVYLKNLFEKSIKNFIPLVTDESGTISTFLYSQKHLFKFSPLKPAIPGVIIPFDKHIKNIFYKAFLYKKKNTAPLNKSDSSLRSSFNRTFSLNEESINMYKESIELKMLYQILNLQSIFDSQNNSNLRKVLANMFKEFLVKINVNTTDTIERLAYNSSYKVLKSTYELSNIPIDTENFDPFFFEKFLQDILYGTSYEIVATHKIFEKNVENSLQSIKNYKNSYLQNPLKKHVLISRILLLITAKYLVSKKGSAAVKKIWNWLTKNWNKKEESALKTIEKQELFPLQKPFTLKNIQIQDEAHNKLSKEDKEFLLENLKKSEYQQKGSPTYFSGISPAIRNLATKIKPINPNIKEAK